MMRQWRDYYHQMVGAVVYSYCYGCHQHGCYYDCCFYSCRDYYHYHYENNHHLLPLQPPLPTTTHRLLRNSCWQN